MEGLTRAMAELVVAALIKRPNGKFLLVGREGLWTLPTGNVESGEQSLDTLFREMREELGIKRELLVVDCLGTVVRRKDDNLDNPLKSIEIFYCKVSAEVAKRIKYREKEESTWVWLSFLEASNLKNLDPVSMEALKRYQQKYLSRKNIAGGGYEGRKVFKWSEAAYQC